MRLLTRRSAPAVLALVCGCNGYPSAPAERALVVHGVLVADAASQEILVEQIRPVSRGVYRGLNPLPGTRVSVAGPHGVVTFREDATEEGRYRASFVPRSGELYTLLVEGPGGERVTAQTLVPRAPRLLAPSRDTAVVQLEQYRVTWSASAPGYIVAQGALDGGPSTRERVVFAYTLRDTTATVAINFNESGHVLRVAAVDSSYVRYTRNAQFGDLRPQNPLRSEVQGGYGVFASTAFSESRRITSQPRSP